MLNSEDQLYISYMSEADNNPDYVPSQVDLSSRGIQKSVDAIRNRTKSGNTPYSAVQAAYNKLKSVQDSNANTQYWLVVITDGSFTDGGYDYDKKDILGRPKKLSSDRVRTTKGLNEKFEEYTASTMPNGTHPQVTFLGIGSITKPDENAAKGIYTYSASGAKDIVATMSSMADRVSGRTRVSTADIKKVDDKTVQVSSTIPLLNIAAFSQRSEAKVVKAVYTNETSIPISRQASLHYPKYSELVGSASLLGDSQSVIGAGTYNITFDHPVDIHNLDILFEPALEMRMTVSVNGAPIKDYRELKNTMEKDKISISCKIYEMGTDNEVDPSLLPPNTKFEILVNENGTEVVRQEGKAVCGGYARAMQYLLQKCGIESAEAIGYIRKADGSKGELHGWNLVKLDGDYYYPDTTWDDRSNTIQTVKDTDASLDYFCFTTDELSRTRDTSKSPAAMPDCTATRCNYYYHNGLVLDVYSMDKVQEWAVQAAQSKKPAFTFQCGNKSIYDTAFAALYADGADCFKILKAATKANKKIDPSGYRYRHDSNMWTITIVFKTK